MYKLLFFVIATLPPVLGQEVAELMKQALEQRMRGAFNEAEATLAAAVPAAVRAYGDRTEQVANALSQLGAVQRALGKTEQAQLTYESCVKIREVVNSAPLDRVRDLAALGRLLAQRELTERAEETLREALALWDAHLPLDGLEILQTVDTLAALHRDKAEYDRAEALLRRALTVREATWGAEASELISTLDSLAYVLFGQKKFAEAEPYYRRLLHVWETSAGEDHPMVALTLDKMAEFYGAQNRYEEAEAVVTKALAIRTIAQLRSMHQTARVKLMQAKLPEAHVLYQQAIRIGDETAMPAEIMDPIWRVEAKILREMKKPAEAAALEKRAHDGVLANPHVRPSPVKLK